jgi:hypothetical protein
MLTQTLHTDNIVSDQPQSSFAGAQKPRPAKPEKSVDIKIDPTVCPARCKRTGMCYGRAWFLGKSGPAMPCDRNGCRWAKSLQKTLQERM